MDVSVVPVGGTSAVVADVSVGGTYSETVLSPQDFGFSTAIVGLIGLPVDGFTLGFDPASSSLSVFEVGSSVVSSVVVAGAAPGNIAVPQYDPVTMSIVSIVYFPTAAGAPVDEIGHLSASAAGQITMGSDTSDGSLLITFQGNGLVGSVELDGSLALTTFRVVAWGF